MEKIKYNQDYLIGIFAKFEISIRFFESKGKRTQFCRITIESIAHFELRILNSPNGGNDAVLLGYDESENHYELDRKFETFLEDCIKFFFESHRLEEGPMLGYG